MGEHEPINQRSTADAGGSLDAGMLRVCCHCGREADHDGAWHAPTHGSGKDPRMISHGICKMCLWRWYPDLAPAVMSDTRTASGDGSL